MKNKLKLRRCLYMLRFSIRTHERRQGNRHLIFNRIGRIILFLKIICHCTCSCIEGMLNEHVHDFIHLHSTLPLPLCL